jgi:Flp pilus assembly protein TadG
VVEFALAVPLLLVLVLGLAEYGTIWQQQSTLTRAAQSAARTGATQGTQRYADYNTIQSLESSLSAIDRLEVERVVVYRADSVDGRVPAACEDVAISDDLSAKGNAAQRCNIYSAAQVAFQGNSLTVYGGTTACAAGSWDQYWCPTTRSRGTDTTDPDHLGVYVSTNYQALTGLLGAPEIKLESDVVFRLEPCITGVSCD